jgi:hypothetical protein
MLDRCFTHVIYICRRHQCDTWIQKYEQWCVRCSTLIIAGLVCIYSSYAIVTHHIPLFILRLYHNSWHCGTSFHDLRPYLYLPVCHPSSAPARALKRRHCPPHDVGAVAVHLGKIFGAPLMSDCEVEWSQRTWRKSTELALSIRQLLRDDRNEGCTYRLHLQGDSFIRSDLYTLPALSRERTYDWGIRPIFSRFRVHGPPPSTRQAA